MSNIRRRRHGLLKYNEGKTFNGYTLFWLLGGRDVWLIDMLGRIVHRWRMPYIPASHAVLLPNGNLLAGCKVMSHEELGLPPPFAGIGGLLLELDWEGNEVWRCDVPYQNHDFDRLSNGNTIYPSWQPKGYFPDELAAKLRGGFPGTELNGKVLGDSIVEIDRQGNMVWEWLVWEHFNPEIDDHCPLEDRSNWPLINSVFALPDGNILASLRYANTVAIIDKKSGDIVWRWGHDILGHQHDARMTEQGNVLVFDNGAHHRRGFCPDYSRILEVNPRNDSIVWEYAADPLTDFYSAVQGGQERLPNGNTLICESLMGRIFEVTMESEIVWEYVVPFYVHFFHHGLINDVFQAHRYEPEYSGLSRRDLNPERYRWINNLYGQREIILK
jgi:hypothetical protein